MVTVPSHLRYPLAEELASGLSPEDKMRLIKSLIKQLDQAYVAQLPKNSGWQPGFIERPPQGDFEERDPIE